MKEIINKKYLNILNSYEDKWIGLTFEAWRINIPIKSLDHVRDMSALENIIEDTEYKGSYVQLELHKYQYESVKDLAHLKKLINDYYKSLEQTLIKAGIYKFDTVFDFYLDHNAYYISLNENKKEVVEKC